MPVIPIKPNTVDPVGSLRDSPKRLGQLKNDYCSQKRLLTFAAAVTETHSALTATANAFARADNEIASDAMLKLMKVLENVHAEIEDTCKTIGGDPRWLPALDE